MQLLTDCSKLTGLDLKYKDYNHHFVTDDGFLISVRRDRPGISKILYYSDEDYSTGEYRTATDIAPNKEALKNCFMSENLRKIRSVTDWLDKHPCGKLFISKNGQYICDSEVRAVATDFPGEEYKYERELTVDEIETIRKVVAEDKKAFEKRLERYWKRYSDKVYISTYWANR